jgi:hypothetical protein
VFVCGDFLLSGPLSGTFDAARFQVCATLS